MGVWRPNKESEMLCVVGCWQNVSTSVLTKRTPSWVACLLHCRHRQPLTAKTRPFERCIPRKLTHLCRNATVTLCYRESLVQQLHQTEKKCADAVTIEKWDCYVSGLYGTLLLPMFYCIKQHFFS